MSPTTSPPATPGGLPQGVITQTDSLAASPRWRREPYLIFFPLGVALAWAGVLHWLLHAVGVLEHYRPVFHAMTQIQGFLMCMAVGFLFTMIPRRTGSAPPAPWEMAVGICGPPLITLAAWTQRWYLVQIPWLVLAATVIAFAVRRFLSSTSRRRPPNSFVWIPIALLMGVAGSVLTAISTWLGVTWAWLHDFGRGLLLQGMFTGLVLGVGALALPLMTRGEAPPDAGSTSRDRLVRTLNLLGALLLVASFWIEVRSSLRVAMLLRAAVVLAVLLGGAQLWRRPRDAWNARVIWIAAWMLPAGFLLAAAFPLQFRAGLHVALIGGFALLSLAVSTQVTLGHGGYEHLMFGKPLPVLGIAGLSILAIVPRALMEFDPRHYFVWMASAAILFLSATLVWAAFLLPKVLRSVSSEGPG